MSKESLLNDYVDKIMDFTPLSSLICLLSAGKYLQQKALERIASFDTGEHSKRLGGFRNTSIINGDCLKVDINNDSSLEKSRALFTHSIMSGLELSSDDPMPLSTGTNPSDHIKYLKLDNFSLSPSFNTWLSKSSVSSLYISNLKSSLDDYFETTVKSLKELTVIVNNKIVEDKFYYYLDSFSFPHLEKVRFVIEHNDYRYFKCIDCSNVRIIEVDFRVEVMREDDNSKIDLYIIDSLIKETPLLNTFLFKGLDFVTELSGIHTQVIFKQIDNA